MAAISKSAQQITAFGFGAALIVVFLGIAILCPNPTPFQYTVFRIILALAAAGVAAMIPGFITAEVATYVRAGGAMAVFAVVYFFSPAELVLGSGDPGITNKDSATGSSGAPKPAQHTAPATEWLVPEIPKRTIAITKPMDGEKASFTLGGGEGGRVNVAGGSHGLSKDDVIILTVTPLYQAEYPQWPEAMIQPDDSGDWSSSVQVGNSNTEISMPKSGQEFTVRATPSRRRRVRSRAGGAAGSAALLRQCGADTESGAHARASPTRRAHRCAQSGGERRSRQHRTGSDCRVANLAAEGAAPACARARQRERPRSDAARCTDRQHAALLVERR